MFLMMYKHPAACWVHLDRLPPGLPASIDARFTAPHGLDITTQHLDGFTLHLASHPPRTCCSASATTFYVKGSLEYVIAAGRVDRDGHVPTAHSEQWHKVCC
jgi:hypothetical protein